MKRPRLERLEVLPDNSMQRTALRAAADAEPQYIGQTHRHVLLDQVLPALLQIKATAILDDALELWLMQNGHAIAKPYKDDLNGRLTYCADHALLSSTDVLHEVRKRRNALAHEPGTRIDWATLKSDIDLVEAALVHSVWPEQPLYWSPTRNDQR